MPSEPSAWAPPPLGSSSSLLNLPRIMPTKKAATGCFIVLRMIRTITMMGTLRTAPGTPHRTDQSVSDASTVTSCMSNLSPKTIGSMTFPTIPWTQPGMKMAENPRALHAIDRSICIV